MRENTRTVEISDRSRTGSSDVCSCLCWACSGNGRGVRVVVESQTVERRRLLTPSRDRGLEGRVLSKTHASTHFHARASFVGATARERTNPRRRPRRRRPPRRRCLLQPRRAPPPPPPPPSLSRCAPRVPLLFARAWLPRLYGQVCLAKGSVRPSWWTFETQRADGRSRRATVLSHVFRRRRRRPRFVVSRARAVPKHTSRPCAEPFQTHINLAPTLFLPRDICRIFQNSHAPPFLPPGWVFPRRLLFLLVPSPSSLL